MVRVLFEYSIFLALIFAPGFAFGEPVQIAKVYPEKGEIEFFASVVPGKFPVHGTSDRLTGFVSQTLEGFQGDLKISLVGFTTDSKPRDQNLQKNVFQSDQFQEASLALNVVPMTGKFYEGPFSGKLIFHAVEKDISGSVKIKTKGHEWVQRAYFTIKLSDFNIPAPEFAGMKVLDEVKIEVNGGAAF